MMIEVSDDVVLGKQNEPSPSKLFMKFLFSHFGLFLIVSIYATVGAYAFVEIENPHEQRLYEIKQESAEAVNQTMTYMANLFWFYQDKEWTLQSFNKTLQKDLKKLEAYIIKAVSKYGYDGTYDGWDWSWTFPNCLLLTMTIMSTIGYGHICPATKEGQVFCVMYAFVGVPLLLVFLGNLGKDMADTFVYIYSRCCCRWCRSRRNDSELPPHASKKQKKLLIDDHVGTEQYMPTDELNVPITLNMVLLFLYIMLGAVFFSVWENWDLASSSYFTFVTLSTIGYGDMVPGSAIIDKDNSSGMAKMLIAIVYILIGMALLSMCINLVQEQIVVKCRWLAKEIGLSGKKDDKDAEDNSDNKDKDKNKDKNKDKDKDKNKNKDKPEDKNDKNGAGPAKPPAKAPEKDPIPEDAVVPLPPGSSTSRRPTSSLVPSPPDSPRSSPGLFDGL